jgi:hypothetical protein
MVLPIGDFVWSRLLAAVNGEFGNQLIDSQQYRSESEIREGIAFVTSFSGTSWRWFSLEKENNLSDLKWVMKDCLNGPNSARSFKCISIFPLSCRNACRRHCTIFDLSSNAFHSVHSSRNPISSIFSSTNIHNPLTIAKFRFIGRSECLFVGHHSEFSMISLFFLNLSVSSTVISTTQPYVLMSTLLMNSNSFLHKNSLPVFSRGVIGPIENDQILSF